MLKGNKVWTPNGYQSGPVNSLVGKGESIIDYTNGTGTLVTKGKVGVDNQPSSVSVNDNNVIAGNDVDWSNGMKFSDQVAPLTAKLQMYNNIEKRAGKKSELSSLSKQTMELQKNQLDRAKAPILQAMKNITDRQEKQHQIEDYAAQIKHNCGKDRFDNGKSLWDKTKQTISSWTKSGKGKVSNSMLDLGYAFPALLETQMLNHWRRENPVMPNIYAANRYAPIALQTMAGNRVSANPILEKLYAQDRQAAYQLANSGGYTGGQRQANRVALALGNQRNVADALMNVQEKNAAYRNAYAEMAARLGDSDAQRLQQSNQYGWEAYNRAHGAKTKGIETHLSNLGLIGQKWLSQRIKNKQYGDILDMYQQDIDNKNAALKAIYGIGADGNKGTTGNTGSTNNSTGSGANNSYTRPTGQPYEMNMYQRNIQPQKNWQDKAMQNIGNLPLPDLPYQHTNYLDTIDWAKYFDAQKKFNEIIIGNNGIPKSRYWTSATNIPQKEQPLFNLIPQLIPTLPDNSKYMQEYQKRMGIPMNRLRQDYGKYLGGDLFVDNGEPLGYTRTSAPMNKKTISKYGFPINRDQMIRGLLLYNNNFKVPSLIPFQPNGAGQSDRLPGFYMNKRNRTNLYTGI